MHRKEQILSCFSVEINSYSYFGQEGLTNAQIDDNWSVMF